ncbi:MAG: DUF3159 domain-containing protein [Streptosporangiales bacterium]|nr:DUF3159 domain-containing protein [Streptosporangiales bacterium]MBO0890583.1 DUF3159 domain-containing protein [Acidothermales bacterium]
MPPAEPGSRPASPPETAEAPEQSAQNPMSADEQRKSLLAAVGGGRGALETSLPGLVFVTVFAFRHDLRLGAVLAGALGVVLLVVRVVRKETTQYAISGFVGVAIAALFAVSTGKAANYFLPSILKNLGFALLYLVSVVVRWPLLGVLLGPLLKENFAWRRHDARRRAYAQATLIWTGMFAIRLAVQLPLYLLDKTVALGVANVVLSWPLFAVVAWATWVVIRRVPPVPAEGASAQ